MILGLATSLYLNMLAMQCKSFLADSIWRGAWNQYLTNMANSRVLGLASHFLDQSLGMKFTNVVTTTQPENGSVKTKSRDICMHQSQFQC